MGADDVDEVECTVLAALRPTLGARFATGIFREPHLRIPDDHYLTERAAVLATHIENPLLRGNVSWLPLVPRRRSGTAGRGVSRKLHACNASAVIRENAQRNLRCYRRLVGPPF